MRQVFLDKDYWCSIDKAVTELEQWRELCNATSKALKEDQVEGLAKFTDLREQSKIIYDRVRIALTEAETYVNAQNDGDPPTLAEFLLIAFATKRKAEYVAGDLNERFARECQEFGRPRAASRYWANTLRSLWPLLVRATGGALKWSAVIAAVRRLILMGARRTRTSNRNGARVPRRDPWILKSGVGGGTAFSTGGAVL
jgi:hypothetical protein